jgi:ubiquinone/menaquinone biosynthesis C-methylase UbiE/GT2 family glycosyltransferase
MRKIPPNDLPWTGERHVTQMKGDIELEHKHRYALACELSKGKRVLDIACGEGYGSEMLSRRAKSVVGVDIDPATVAHAIKKYHSPKMRFLEGACEKIPLPDKSVDLVVSFETLEHFEDHNKFFREIERVLDSGGILVISTPEKAAYSDKPTYVNPFHKKELNREQFLQLLSQNYSHMTYFEQKVTGGSWLIAPKDRTMGFLSFHLNEQVGGISSRNGLKDALYIVAVCSNAPLPVLAGSMYEAEFWVRQGMQDLSNQLEQQEKRAIEKNNLAKPKPGFWRRLEQSIRKKRKWVQAIWGFDACWYLETNPDVKEAGVDPLKHYLQYGIQEGRRKSKKDHSTSVKPPLSVPFDKYLPSLHAAWRPPADLSVMVIVPVYKGKEETQRCIRSLLRNTDDIPAEILVIIDDSPDAELVGWLEEVAADGKIKLIRNEKNLGFVASANRGMAWAGLRDVILLNSDTEVPSGWMKRLAGHAYSAEKIGTVTPFSNHATICSWPTHQGGDLPDGRSVDEIDAAFREGNCGRQVAIPTGVGFCMYLRRTCLDEVGLFDEISFGRGYGEENDFCMRAHGKGWKHLMACDLFVAHAGQTSFGKNAPEFSKAWETVCRLHPKYPHLVAEHIQTDEGGPYRFAATATLFRKATEPTILMVSHNWGGGTQRHVNELVKVLGSSANVLLLQGDPSGVRVSVPSLPGHPHMILGNHEVDKLHALLCSFGVDRVHIHHWIDLKINLKELIQKLKVPFDLTVHDYYSICPQITLMKKRNSPYCGEPDEKECDACIQENPHNGAIIHGAKTIADWRNDSHWMLNEAKRVICPSADVKNRMSRYVPQANFIVVPHENVAEPMWRVANPKITQNQKVRIGLIGWLSPHKGLENVVETVTKCDPEKYEFIHIGYSEPELPIQVKARVRQVGRYQEDELPRLIEEAKLHMIWFPAIWPEVYSYTLSAAIEGGLPITAPKIGAFPERLSGRPLTWVVESYQKPDEWLKLFEKVRSTFISTSEDAVGRRASTGTLFYPEEYLKPACRIQSFAEKQLRRKRVVLILDSYSGLCNQMMDIESLVGFAVENQYRFCFRHSSSRNPDLVSWTPSEFGSLFDENQYHDMPGYLCWRKIRLKSGEVWNSDGRRLIELIKTSEELHKIAYEYNFLVIKQGWPVLGFPKTGFDLGLKIKPSKRILSKYKSIRDKLPQNYNFLHYRYEHDFTSHFSAENPENSFPILQKILDAKLFSDTDIPIYIAASGLATLPKSHLRGDIREQKNILFTDEKKIDDFNFEAAAYLDFLIGEQAVEVFGHSRSSFSHRLNNIKKSKNYYDLQLA